MIYPGNDRVLRCSCAEGWNYSDEIIRRFEAALYPKVQPSRRGGLQRVKLPHRFTGPDMEVAARNGKVGVSKSGAD